MNPRERLPDESELGRIVIQVLPRIETTSAQVIASFAVISNHHDTDWRMLYYFAKQIMRDVVRPKFSAEENWERWKSNITKYAFSETLLIKCEIGLVVLVEKVLNSVENEIFEDGLNWDEELILRELNDILKPMRIWTIFKCPICLNERSYPVPHTCYISYRKSKNYKQPWLKVCSSCANQICLQEYRDKVVNIFN